MPNNYPFGKQGIYNIHSPINQNKMKKPIKQTPSVKPSGLSKTLNDVSLKSEVLAKNEQIDTLTSELESQKDVIQRLRDTCSRHDRMLQEEKRRTEEVATKLSGKIDELAELQGKWYVRWFGR